MFAKTGRHDIVCGVVSPTIVLTIKFYDYDRNRIFKEDLRHDLGGMGKLEVGCGHREGQLRLYYGIRAAAHGTLRED